MASKKMVAFFTDATGYGWSETTYYNGPVDLPTMTTNVQNWCQARSNALTNMCMITHVRVASPIKRDPYIIQPGVNGPIPGGETPPTAPSEVALLVEYQAQGIGYNRSFIRGIPERVVQADSYVPDAQFNANIQGYITFVTASIWNVVGTLGGDQTQFPVTTLIPNSPKGYSFVCPTQTFAVGSQVQMHGAKVPGYNGRKTVTQQPAGSHLHVVAGAAPPVADSGTAQYVTVPGHFDNQIGQVVIAKVSRRGAGRPFGLSRGRRPTLYSLRQ